MGDKATILSTISPVIQYNGEKNIGTGTLSLVLYPPYYSICFQKSGDQSEPVLSTNLINLLSKSEKNVNLLCHEINSFHVNEELLSKYDKENEDDKKAIVLKISISETHYFIISEDNIPNISYFFQQIIIHGIAGPQAAVNKTHTLSIYKSCHEHSFVSKPSHIQLIHPFYTSLDDFWSDLMKFYCEYISFLFSSKCLTYDPNYPLNFIINAFEELKMNEINIYIENLPKYQKITFEEFDSLFDSEGALIDKDLFKNRLFHAGCDDLSLPKAIPFAVGVYPLESTLSQREEIDKKLKFDFQRLLDQVSTISKKQSSRNKKLRESLRVINQDADRTDRIYNAFKDPKKPGIYILTILLKCYCVYDQQIGYLQGMNDLFVPLILSFIPKWSNDGDPIDQNDQIISNDVLISDFLPIIFFCYYAIIHLTGHAKLLSNVTERTSLISHIMVSIVSKFDPILGIWLSQNNIHEFLWMYSDFIYLYKRAFNDSIWDIWLQMCCFPSPHEWLLYFASAVLIEMLPQISLLSDLSMPSMMDYYPRVLKSLDKNKIGKVSLYLYQNYRLTDDDFKVTVGKIYGVSENFDIDFNEEEDIESFHFEFLEFDK